MHEMLLSGPFLVAYNVFQASMRLIPPIYQTNMMEDIEKIVRRMGQQQAENMYYRECYALLKHLQDDTQQTVNKLKELYDSHHHPLSNVQETLADLRNTICGLVRNACQAQLECEDLCRKRPSLSAYDAFGSMAKMCDPAESRTGPMGDNQDRQKKIANN